ncbi:IS1 ORF [Shigella sonnei]|uniref:Transposase n=2 Tax=Shigella sonnei TaxID=624 RepID=A0AAU8W2H5_SHISO|nr:Mobile element protein [Shigella sonnei]ARS06570.1 transposase [Shigella sonnei]SRH63690.1 IS1 ORF [Shigella sonnei]SRH88317.1 IS1 ORF [Shigella sonnei]SRK15173.1 IS1 ORF [Shigella sonnei]
MPGNCTHYGRWPQHDFTSLKKLRPQSVTSRIQPGSDVIVCAEMDEQWGYVGAKSRQRSLFYAYDSLRKTVVAHVFGERTMATLGRLMSLLSPFDVVIWMTDGWPLYESRLKGKLHVISKRYTQRIERHNLNLRQHLARLGRKSLSFSKSVELHDKVIGHYLASRRIALFFWALIVLLLFLSNEAIWLMPHPLPNSRSTLRSERVRMTER